jgi:hypothetical protein
MCSRIGMCSGMWVYVLTDVHSLCSKCECVLKDWYVCSGMCIVCVRGLVYVLRDVGICAHGCA